MIDIQLLSNIAGLISFGAVVIGGFFFMKSGVGKQTSEAQQSAINALQTELTILRGRVADTEKENRRLEQIFRTIVLALQKKGMIITIDGEMITIQDNKGASTTIRIHRDVDDDDK